MGSRDLSPNSHLLTGTSSLFFVQIFVVPCLSDTTELVSAIKLGKIY